MSKYLNTYIVCITTLLYGISLNSTQMFILRQLSFCCKISFISKKVKKKKIQEGKKEKKERNAIIDDQSQKILKHKNLIF